MRLQRLIPTVLTGALAALAVAAVPALAAPPETPTIQPALSVTGSSAVFRGTLNPGGPAEPGEWEFKYKISNELCFPEAHSVPEPAAQSTGKAKEAVEAVAENLEPGTTYAFCLAANPNGERALSESLTFKTLPIGLTRAREVTPFAATLTAQINPENEETTYSFEYSTEASGEELKGAIVTIPGTSTLPAVDATEEASVPTKNVLAPATTYYFRVLTENSKGTDKGPVESFTTREATAPEVISTTLKELNSNEPQLEAKINPNYEEASYQFEYSNEESGGELQGTITTVKGAPPSPLLPAVSEEREAGPVGLQGLSPGLTYYYRVSATNSTGTTHGPVQSFIALGIPAVSTAPAGEPTRTTATVAGSITPQGLPTTYHFAYVPLSAYEAALAKGAADPYASSNGGRSTYETSLDEKVADYAPHPVAATLEELAPETTYVYALVASNELGPTTGGPRTFTTQAAIPPLAATGPALGISQLAATITGSVDTRGLQTSIQFELGTAPYAGALLPAAVVPGSEAGTSEQVQRYSTGLQPGTTYYYRLIATGPEGVATGAEQSFTTPGFPAAFPSATLPAPVPYTPIAALDAREAREGKATGPVKKKAKGKRSRQHRRHGKKTKQRRRK